MEAGQGEDFGDIIRVLHVDDEPNTLRFCKMLLEMIDPSIRVVSSISPGEATGLLKERRFDCIVSDYQMPEEDGVEFVRAWGLRPRIGLL
jgi:CheY-like chemotaxis protein